MNFPAVRMALLALVFTIAWTLVEHYAGFNTTRHDIGQYTRMVVPLVFYVLVVYAIPFARALRIGAATAVIFGALSAFWFAIYAEIINPAYASTLREFELKKLENAHATPEQKKKKMKDVSLNSLSSGGSFLSYFLLFVFMTFFGCAVALVAAFVLKKKKAD